MDKDIRSRNYIVDKLMKESTQRDKAVKDNKDKIKDLETKSCDHEDKLFALNAELESFKMNFQISQRGMDGVRSKFEEMENYGERLGECERAIVRQYCS